MKFVSIDVETTGLDPTTCQILEIGAVFVNDDLEIQTTKPFQCFIKHDLYIGESFALQMNAWILKILADDKHERIFTEQEAVIEFGAWVDSVIPTRGNITYAGKNYGSFDLQFLKRMKGWEYAAKPGHRSIDVGSLFLRSEDVKIPDLKECLNRAGIFQDVTHDAVGDATAVAECIIRRFK